MSPKRAYFALDASVSHDAAIEELGETHGPGGPGSSPRPALQARPGTTKPTSEWAGWSKRSGAVVDRCGLIVRPRKRSQTEATEYSPQYSTWGKRVPGHVRASGS